MTSKAYHFTAYGLHIKSDFLIHGLYVDTASSKIDLTIKHVPELSISPQNSEYELIHDTSKPHSNTSKFQVFRDGKTGDYYWRYPDGTACHINASGSQLRITWGQSETEETASIYILGPILGFILRLKQFVCLHASAFERDNKVIAFVGKSGAGKSTLAATFASKGYRVLCDDVLTIDPMTSPLLVIPGHPRLKLWSSASEMIFGEEAELPNLLEKSDYWRQWDKRYLDLHDKGYTHSRSRSPLHQIYVLEWSQNTIETPQIRDFPTSSDALIALISNSYTNYVLTTAMRSLEFSTLAKVVQTITVRKLVRSYNMNSQDVAEFILNDLDTVRP